MEAFRMCMTTIIYISVAISVQTLQELALVACLLHMLIFTLLKKSFNLGHFMISFIGFSGVILSLHQIRQGHVDQIDDLTTIMIFHLQIWSKTFFSILVAQIYKLKQLFEKKAVFKKLFLIKVLTVTMIAVYMLFVCYTIDKVQVWINNGLLETGNNSVNIYANIETYYSEKVVTNISDCDLAAKQKVFLVDEHKSSLLSTVYASHKDMNSTALTQRNIQRFIGEEVELICSSGVSLKNDNSLYTLSLFFEHDAIEVRNSTRRRLKLPEEKIRNDSYYIFSLTLFDIQPEDFGIYRAGIRVISRSGSSFSVSSATMYRFLDITEVYGCVFNLSQLVDYYEYVDVHAGALLSFKHPFVRSGEDDLRVEHYVNGIPVNMVSNISSKCCLPSVRFWWEIWNQVPLNLPSINIKKSETQQVSVVTALVCACSPLYGIHSFKFYNDVYDWKRKMWTTSEFWHPHIIVVYPKSSNVPWNTLSETESRLIDKSKIERTFSLFEGDTFELLKSNIDDDFVLMQFIEICLILGIFVFLICVALFSLRSLLILVSKFKSYAWEQLGLILRMKLPDPGGNLANPLHIRDACQNYIHDVFVLYDYDDRTFVRDELYKVIIDQRLSVFLSEEDLPPGPIIENLKQALTKSKKVIVIVSNSFKDNELYNKFFLPGIVLLRLNKGLIDSGHLMLLVSVPCRVPLYLMQDYRIVTLDYTRNSKDIFLRKLNKWLESPVILEGFGEQPMLHSDLLQLSQV